MATSPARPPRATTTTYALLGLLAVRPWTGYELTAQARRSLHAVWPRSEANLYTEQKRLVALGWATAAEDHVGRRPRTTYTITKAGRKALDDWVKTEPAPPRVEMEGLLRIMYADQAEVGDVVAALRVTADHARREIEQGMAIVHEYASGDGAFPDRAHLVALIADFMLDLHALVERYATETAARLSGWDTTRRDGVDEETAAMLSDLLARGAAGQRR